MSDEQDIRWMQRFSNYQKALRELEQEIKITSAKTPSKLEKKGLIQTLEYTYELAWKILKDFLEAQGDRIHGPRDAIRLAFNRGVIENGQTWMDMIDSRNETVHTYNENTAEKIYRKIIDAYCDEFLALEKTMLARKVE